MTPTSEAADVVRRLYDAFANPDTDKIERLGSDDERAVAIGTDPHEWLVGGREIKAQLHEQLAGGALVVKAGDPIIHHAGDVIWFADKPAFVLPDGQEVPCRLTAVLHRENGEWKVIQSHTSLGVPNEKSFGS